MGRHGRRTRVLIVLFAAVGLLATTAGPLQWAGAATGSDPDAELAVSDATPLAGATVDVALSNVAPDASVSVQLCVGAAATTPTGQPVKPPTTYDAEACRPLGELGTDGSGSAAGQVTLPADGYLLGGRCTYEAVAGAGSFSFGGTVIGACTLAAIDDTGSDRLTPLATAPLGVRLGDGSVSGSFLDTATGERLSEAASFDGQICPVEDMSACVDRYSWGSPLLEQSDDGELTLSGLADGDYVVFGTHYGGLNRGSDVRKVSVVDGAPVRADLRIPRLEDSDFASSASGIELSVAPDLDVPFDAPLEVSASGFDPGDEVQLAFCSTIPTFTLTAGELQLTCSWPAATVGTATADGTGAVGATVAFDRSRFTTGCRDYYLLNGGESFSFGFDPRCYLVAFESTGSPSFAWSDVEFRSPAGEAVVRGTVTADGVEIPDATVSLYGDLGFQYQRTGATGGYGFSGQPDGEVTVTAVLPDNYHFASYEDQGPDSISFGIGQRHLARTATVADQQDVAADFDFDIEPGGVAGTVRSADGTPAPGATVQLTGDGFWLNTAAAESGEYSFHGLPDGTYTVMAYAYDESGVQYAIDQIVVAGGAVVAHDIRFPLMNSSISGRVIGTGGEPYPGAEVSACLAESDGWWFGWCRSTSVAADGSFTLGELSAGTWEVSAYAPFSAWGTTSVRVTVGEDEDVTGVELVLERASGSVAGSVADDVGEPVAGASVYLCSLIIDDWIGACAYAVTDGSGDYVVAGVPDGPYRVSVFGEGFAGASTDVEVADGGATAGVDLVVRPYRVVPPGTSVGGVSGDSGVPSTGSVFPFQPTPVTLSGQCPGASVRYTLTGDDGAVWASGTLQESGSAPGSYAGSISPLSGRAGRGELSITVDCPAGGPDPEPILIDIYIDPSGNVVDLDGNPVDGATVTLSRSDTAYGPFIEVPDDSEIMSPENRTNPDLTDDAGHFGWLTVPGFYKVRAEKDGCHAPGAPEQSYVETAELPVPPEQVGLELVLDCSPASGEDQTPPTVALQLDPEPNENGWNSSPVTARVVASDDGSGVASSTLVVDGVETGEVDQQLTDGETEVAGRATDRAGNVATTAVRTARIDLEDPTVSIAAPLDGATVSVGDQLLASYSCADGESGIDTCDGDVADGAAIDTSAPGPRELQVTATDRAGRTTTRTVTVTVTDAAPTRDEIGLAFTGSVRGTWSGPVSGGDLAVTRNAAGVVERIRGTVELPGANGSVVTATVKLDRVWILDVYVGEIRLDDPGVKVRQSTPVLLERIRQAPDGTLSGSASWFTGFLSPYRLAWSMRDVSGAST